MLQDGDGAIPDGMSGECGNGLPPPSRGRLTQTVAADRDWMGWNNPLSTTPWPQVIFFS